MRHLRRSDQIGHAIVVLRRTRGLTQAETSARAGVSRKWLSDFENGKSSAEIGLLLRVLDVLGYEFELHAAAPPRQDLDAFLETFADTGEAL